MRVGNILDRLLGVFSPRSEYKRRAYRAALDVVERHYEAASLGRRNGGWVTSSTSANSAARGKLARIRDRSHDLIRNNGWADHAVEVYESEIVGTGIVPRFVHKDEKIVATLKELWAAHCETTKIDADGRLDIYGIQALMVRTIFESGEVLIRRRRRLAKDGLALPFVVDVLEPDYLDESRDNPRLASGGRISGGIQLDAIARREGYWLFAEHPGDSSYATFLSTLVAASEVLHVFRMQRPKQLRGLPTLTPVMQALRDLDLYEDFEMVRKQVTACFAVIVSDPLDADGPKTGVVKPNPLPEKVEPGGILNLPGGKTASFVSPPADAGFSDFEKAYLRKIAAGIGLTYEAISGEGSTVTYSSARMGWLTNARSIDRFRWNVLVAQGLNPFASWVVEAAVLSGKIPDVPVGVVWTPPRRAMLDPKIEVPARRDAIRAGFQSPAGDLREEGLEAEEVWQESAKNFARMRELGLRPESDPTVPLQGAAPAADASNSQDSPLPKSTK